MASSVSAAAAWINRPPQKAAARMSDFAVLRRDCMGRTGFSKEAEGILIFEFQNDLDLTLMFQATAVPERAGAG
jgi:hypothetical protein